MNLRDYCEMNTMLDMGLKMARKGISRQQLNSFKDRMATYMEKMSREELNAFIGRLSSMKAEEKTK